MSAASGPSEDFMESLARLSFAEFLANSPPGTLARLTDLARRRYQNANEVVLPDLTISCSNPICGGIRQFRPKERRQAVGDDEPHVFCNFVCRNCEQEKKAYALVLYIDDKSSQVAEEAYAIKVGELPAFGPPIPTRTISLVGPDRDIFLQGRRCENQGFGIGAYAYYRRVIENQWHRLLGEIAKACERTSADSALVAQLRAAQKETSFKRAFDTVTGAIPSTLLINGQSPLTLLHTVLSDGVHDRTDEECLEQARSIRVVLYDLAERLDQVLRDQSELDGAVSVLMRTMSERKKPSSPKTT
jgi:hypothetical protein